MKILDKITELRTERDWSMFRLSEESGLSQSTLANMYARKTDPSLTTLKALCDAFGITLSEFFAENQTELKNLKSKQFLESIEVLTEPEKKSIINLITTFKNNQKN